MNLESTTNSASASGPEFESQSYKIRVRDVSLVPNGQTSVRGFSLATLAAALAACGGGGSGGPAAPPPPPPPPPNNAPTASPDAGAATEDGEAVTGGTGAADADDDSLTYSVTGDATYGSLTVADDGTWTYTVDNANDAVQGLAEGAELSDTATITVSDGEDSVEATVTITITGVNDAPTGEDGTGAATAGMDVAAEGSVNPADVDDGDTHTFAVTEGMYGTFAVDEAGAWTYSLDHDNEAVVALDGGDEPGTLTETATITITDSSGGTADVTVTVTITGSNDDPTISVMDGVVPNEAMTPANAANDENMAGIPLGSVVIGDPDSGQMLSADNVTTSDPERFIIKTDDVGGLWLALADGVSLDHEDAATVDVTVTVTDDHGATAESVVTITVNNVDEAPYAPTVTPSASNLTVTENVVSGVNLAQLTSHDPEEDAITYAVDNENFEIETVGDAVLLKLKDGVSLDREAMDVSEDGTLTLMVTASDPAGNTSAATPVVVTITNVNEKPTLSVVDGETPDGMPAVSTILENETGPVGLVVVSDPEQTITEANLTVDDDRFGFMTDDLGGIWLVLNEGIDADTEASVTLEVEVIDDGGLAVRSEVTINITGVNEVPTVTVTDSTTPDGKSARAVISENETGPVGLITLSDQEEMLDEMDITLSNPKFGTMTDHLGGIWLVLNEAADYETDGGTLTVTVTVTDSDGLTSEAVVNVAVGNVDENPSISVMDGETPEGLPAVSVIEEDATGPVGAVTVSDPEGTLGEADIEVSDERFAIMTDALGGLWLVLNEGIDADALEDGTVSLTLTVTDSGGHTAEAEVLITITDINEPPTITVEPGVVPAADGGAGASGAIAENATGPVYEIKVADPEDELTKDNVAIDDTRFIVKDDSEGGLWAVLNEEVNYEELGEVKSIDIVVTVTDSGGLTAMSTKTVTINDANDAPKANQVGVEVITTDAVPAAGETPAKPAVTESMTNLIATAGTGVVQMTLDLGAMFSDEDGDTNFRYHLEDGPDWLKLINVQYGSDGSVTGQLVGTAPDEALPETLNIKLVATDEGGASGDATFNVILDDGNDRPTNITLTNADGTENAFLDVDVNENDATGKILGYLDVDDQDSELHPNGQHKWTVDKNDPNKEKFEFVVMDDGRVAFKVVDGVTFDHEESSSSSSITVTVTATDQGAEKYAISEDITVDINDLNDDPIVKNAPGNWWVTAPDNLDEEDVVAGGWLIFEVENQFDNDAFPLFTDQDDDDNELSYSLVGDSPSWLEIDAETGVIQNTKGAVPVRGVYDVTVRATDSDDASAQASFKLAVAVSDDDDDDNDRPDIERGSGNDIDENSAAGTVVATLTIADEDLDLEGIHPWGDLTITIVANDVDDDIPRVLQADTIVYTPTSLTPKGASFNLVETGRDSESITYDLVLTATGSGKMDHEMVEDVRLTITVTDGITGSTDSRNINFDVDDVSEPAAIVATEASADTHSTVVTGNKYTVEQQAEAVEMIYLNLTKLHADPDQGTDPEDLLFSVSVSNTPWLTLVHGAVAWEDIKEGPDDDSGDAASDADNVMWGPDEKPDDDDIVVILRVDRTGTNDAEADDDARPRPREIGQDADGAITITIFDDDGPEATEGTTKITVAVMDEDLNPGDDTSTTSGVKVSDKNPDQGDTIRMTFNASVDPDFTGEKKGSPVVILYQWSRGETLVDVAVDNPSPYSTTEADVGMTITGSVVYYELFDADGATSDPAAIVKSSSADDAGGMLLQATTAAVGDRQDAATGTITFTMTNAANELVANARSIMDLDGMDVDAEGSDATAMTFTWEWSENGRGGWKPFADGDDETDNDNDAMTVIPAAQQGNYVRLVVTFKDDNGTNERVVSDAIKVGAISTLVIDDADDPVVIDPGPLAAGAVPVGRVLTIDNLPKGASVQWMSGPAATAKPIAGATANEFTVTSAQAGMPISAVITSLDAKGATTSIVTLAVTANVVGTVAANSVAQVVAEAADIHDVGAATNSKGEIFETSTTVNMASLFDDAEDDKLTFNFTTPAQEFGTDQNAAAGSGDIDVYESGTDGGNAILDQLLFVNEATGAVQYFTTLTHTHDGEDLDGDGNLVTMTLVANDGTADSAAAMVSLRIDVKATAIAVSAPMDVTENAEAPKGGLTIATIDVQDENMTDHAYGSYTFTVSDDRFQVVADRKDGSKGVLKLKAGATLDFEGDMPISPVTEMPTAFKVTVTATPVSGNFKASTKKVTIVINDDPDDNADAQPMGNEVPGLKDNEASDGDDTEDSDDDDDDDGGTPEADDAMAAFASMLDDGLF